MLDGLWTATFQSNQQTLGSGVVVITGDTILGGDGVYYYEGSLSIEGEIGTIVLNINRYGPGLGLFGNLERFSLQLSGRIASGEIRLAGFVRENRNLQFVAHCVKRVEIKIE